MAFILITLGLSITRSISCNAQSTYPDNRIYLTFQPEDFGTGIRIDHNNIYESFSYGNKLHLSADGFIKHHFKASVGYIVSDVSKYKWIQGITIGLAFHSYGKKEEHIPMPKLAESPISFELGVRTTIFGKGCVALRYDPIMKWGLIDIGYCFIHHNY